MIVHCEKSVKTVWKECEKKALGGWVIAPRIPFPKYLTALKIAFYIIP